MDEGASLGSPGTKSDENVLQQCVEKWRADDHQSTVILHLVLEQPGKFKECVVQREMPLQVFSGNPERIVLGVVVFVHLRSYRLQPSKTTPGNGFGFDPLSGSSG